MLEGSARGLISALFASVSSMRPAMLGEALPASAFSALVIDGISVA